MGCELLLLEPGQTSPVQGLGSCAAQLSVLRLGQRKFFKGKDCIVAPSCEGSNVTWCIYLTKGTQKVPGANHPWMGRRDALCTPAPEANQGRLDWEGGCYIGVYCYKVNQRNGSPISLTQQAKLKHKCNMQLSVGLESVIVFSLLAFSESSALIIIVIGGQQHTHT
eukprot:1157362-Pelagomonas_calceolata.AAC.2